MLLVLSTSYIYSQDLELNWTEKMRYDNSQSGYFDRFIGYNNDYVYSLFNDLSYKSNATNKRLDIVAFDKTDMTRIATLKLRDKDNARRKEKLKNKSYLKAVILENVVYVFWEESDKKSGVTKIFAEVYDQSLNQVISLQEVYSVTYPKVKKRVAARKPIVILSGKEWNNDVLVGTEISHGQGEEIEFEYIILNDELDEVAAERIDLSLVQTARKTSGLASSYRYGEDGNVYIQSRLVLSKEDRYDLEEGEQYTYTKLSVLDPLSGDLTSNDIRFEGKNVFDFGYEVNENGVRIFGFYNDLSIDRKGLSTNGIFHATLDPKSGEIEEPIFSEFDKKTLDELFKDDKEDKRRTRSWSKKKRKKNEAIDAVSLDDRYVIENIHLKEDGSFVLFCSKMYNYTVTVCTSNANGGQSCREVPYCEKSNVTAFSLDKNGELLWSKNIDRERTYGGWYIYDLRVLTRGDKAYVIYGSSYDVDAEVKRRRTRKSKSEARDKFEYAVFDLETGDAEKHEFVVNEEDTEKKDRKYFSPLGVTVMDGEYYVSSKRVTFKPGLTVAGCAASVVCFPVIYFVIMHPAFRKGEGYLGKLDIIE